MGCGEGNWAKELAESREGIVVYAFDTDIELLREEKFPDNCHCIILDFLTMELPPKLKKYGAEVIHSRCARFLKYIQIVTDLEKLFLSCDPSRLGTDVCWETFRDSKSWWTSNHY